MRRRLTAAPLCLCPALLLAAWGLPAASAQAGAPMPPQQLAGALTDDISSVGVFNGVRRARETKLELQNIQLKLDKVSNGQARYVIQGLTLTISGAWGDCTATADPAAGMPWVGAGLTIPWSSSTGLQCGAARLEQWQQRYLVDCHSSAGPPHQFFVHVPNLPQAGEGHATAAGNQVYVKLKNSRRYNAQNVLYYVPDPTGPYDVTETLTGWFSSSGKDQSPLDLLTIAGVSHDDKQSVGGLVIKHLSAADDPDGDNMAPRMKLTLQKIAGDPQSKLVLDPPQYSTTPSANGPGPMVNVFTQPTGGKPLQFNGDNVFDSASLPNKGKDLYIEGAQTSDTMRDIQISAHLRDDPDCNDTIALTVLGVDQPSIQTGKVSGDNRARAYFATTFGTDQLGLRPYPIGFNVFLSIPDVVLGPDSPEVLPGNTGFVLGHGVEGKAVVHPQGFSYPGVHLKLDRDAQSAFWSQTPGSAMCMPIAAGNWKKFLAHIPPGNDALDDPPSPDEDLRDDDPRSSNALYNLDVTGIEVGLAPSPRVYRARGNFKLFAAIDFGTGQVVRCSPITHYWVRSSWRQAVMPGQYTWVLATDIPGDNLLTTGTTGSVACDLK